MNSYSKLYCKAKNLLKITVNNTEYSFKYSLKGTTVDSLTFSIKSRCHC
jgi:hypothetical protein